MTSLQPALLIDLYDKIVGLFLQVLVFILHYYILENLNSTFNINNNNKGLFALVSKTRSKAYCEVGKSHFSCILRL